MLIVNIGHAKTHLSKLVHRAVKGEPFVIAKAREPLVKVEALDAPRLRRRLGFLAGEIDVPADFDHMGEAEIRKTFLAGARGARNRRTAKKP
jgi:antitoxin (DNA-binding transcriptional repressor) of toxin-antitoxin stability system